MFVTPASDYDLYIILREKSERYPFNYGARIEMIAQPLDEFRRHGLPGSGKEWNRPTFQHVRVEIDKLDGEIQRLGRRERPSSSRRRRGRSSPPPSTAT